MKMIITPISGEDMTVDVRHGDKLRAERTMLAKGYGTATTAPGTWLSLAVHAAARRAGLDVPEDFDDFTDSIDDIKQAPADEVDAAPFQ